MKVLLIIESGGGSGRHFADLASELVRQNHEVVAIYSPKRLEARYVEKLQMAGLKALEAFPMERDVGPADLKAFWDLRSRLRRLGPFDVIHAHSSKAGALARLGAPRHTARVYTPHAFRTMDPNLGPMGRAIYGGVERWFARTATEALIAVSPEEFEHAKHLGARPETIAMVLNGIEAPAAVDRKATRLELGLGDGDFAIGFVGRFCAQKAPMRFADAIAKAGASNPRIRGVMFGDGEMKAEVAAREIPNLSIVSGRNAQDYLPALDVFALTSLYEGMPYVLVEALYAGLPIVTSDVGGVAATVTDGKNGRVLPVRATASDFADAFVEMAGDPQTLKRFATESLALSSQMSVTTMVAETVKVYEGAKRRVKTAGFG